VLNAWVSLYSAGIQVNNCQAPAIMDDRSPGPTEAVIGYKSGYWLVLLHHIFRCTLATFREPQQGHRGRRSTRATTSRRRSVVMAFGIWRSGRSGGAVGSVTDGNGKRLGSCPVSRACRGENRPFDDQDPLAAMHSVTWWCNPPAASLVVAQTEFPLEVLAAR
jgi:hypothetical protein